MKMKYLAIFGLAMCLCAARGLAQAPAKPEKPVAPADKPAAEKPAGGLLGDAPVDVGGAADAAAADKAPVTMTPEQYFKFVEDVRQKRLAMERAQVKSEIEDDSLSMLFDEDKQKQAVKLLADNPKNTWEDNAQRIIQAYALVDARFGSAMALSAKGKHLESAQALKAIISDRDSNYFTAVKRYCYADELATLDNKDDAVEAYTDLVKAMPDRFTFASLALLKAGKTYEKMHRLYYAMTLYNLWTQSFGLVDPEGSKELGAKADQIAKDYKDPLATLAGKMDDVTKRLSGIDSGRATQERQREIVTMLDDLIATAEEQSAASSSSSGNASKPGQGQKPGDASGQTPGGGKKPGPAGGVGIPTQGATESRLVDGAAARPSGLADVIKGESNDDWGKLPPMEQQKLLETFKETMPERYREMISDYYRKMAKSEGAEK
jgi:tetratricopeptide (TPR) repeat protein